MCQLVVSDEVRDLTPNLAHDESRPIAFLATEDLTSLRAADLDLDVICVGQLEHMGTEGLDLGSCRSAPHRKVINLADTPRHGSPSPTLAGGRSGSTPQDGALLRLRTKRDRLDDEHRRLRESSAGALGGSGLTGAHHLSPSWRSAPRTRR